MGRRGVVISPSSFTTKLLNVSLFLSYIFAFDQTGKTSMETATSFYILCQYAPACSVWSSKTLNNGSELCCPKGACAIVKYTVPRHTCTYHKEEATRTLSYIYRNWYYLWIELSGWMGSVSYGLGADISLPPCLSVTIGIWTLAYRSDPPTEISGEIVWYDIICNIL